LAGEETVTVGATVSTTSAPDAVAFVATCQFPATSPPIAHTVFVAFGVGVNVNEVPMGVVTAAPKLALEHPPLVMTTAWYWVTLLPESVTVRAAALLEGVAPRPVELMATVGITVFFVKLTVTGVEAFPAASVWVAWAESAPSGRLLKLKVVLQVLPAWQTGLEESAVLTILTETCRPASEQVPLTGKDPALEALA